MAVCGLQSAENLDCLLSSLPSELTFNQLRDAARRHSKQERCSAAALHSVASKATTKHLFGCSSLELQDADWAAPIGRGTIKSSIHSGLRATDKELGISAEGLTRHKTNRNFTKPHVWTSRLDLVMELTNVFAEAEGSEEDKRVHVQNVHHDMWISKVVPELCFLRQKTGGADTDFPERALITTRSGPYTVGCIKVKLDGETTYAFEEDPYMTVIAQKLDQFEVALCRAVLAKEGHLLWQRDGQWMSIPDYIADHSIVTMPAALLASVMAKMKIPCGKLDHVHRAELFLKHMERSNEWIETVVEQIAARQRKKKEKKEAIFEKEDGEDWAVTD